MIEERFLDPDHQMPLLIQPERDAAPPHGVAALATWVQEHEAYVEQRLLERGAILFRGYGATTPGAFARFTRAVSTHLLDGREENVPRTKLTAGIYTSTEYPPEYVLSMHSEYSYSHRWPARLFFCCIVAAREGGETPIVDTRQVLRSLDPAVVEEFEHKKVTYTRNLHDGRGFGLSWQTAFETTDRAAVEEYCRGFQVELAWTETGVRLTQTLDGIIRHPKTGELVWFNQAPQFHPSDYPPEIFRSLVSVYQSESELPQHVCFGDGTAMDPSVLAHVRETMLRKASRFPWQEGDVLMLDNMLVAHGRMSFVGPRKVLVAMSDD